MAGVTGMKRSASPAPPVSPPPLKRKIESTTTSKLFSHARLLLDWNLSDNVSAGQAVASFFTPASQKKPEKVTWRIVNNSLVVGKYSKDHTQNQQLQGDGKRKVAAFDLVRFASGDQKWHEEPD